MDFARRSLSKKAQSDSKYILQQERVVLQAFQVGMVREDAVVGVEVKVKNRMCI
jgi:hypothetical protein